MSNNILAKGLLVTVMGPDCTAGGITSGKRKAVLIGPGIPEIFSPSPDAPALYFAYELDPVGAGPGALVAAKDHWAWDRMDWNPKHYADVPVIRARAVPVGLAGNPLPGGMMGGHYVTTSDSRFPVHAPIPVHDRFE